MSIRKLLLSTIFSVVFLGSFVDAKASCISIPGVGCGPDIWTTPVVIKPVSPANLIYPFSPLQLIPFQSGNVWNYSFSVGTPVGITAFEIPFFGGWSPTEDSSLTGYTVELVPSAGASTAMVRWTNQNPASFGNGVWVSFTSEFAPTVARINVMGLVSQPTHNDFFMPFTPAAEAAGYSPYVYAAAVPEPEQSILMIAGLYGLSIVVRRRRLTQISKKKSDVAVPLDMHATKHPIV